MAGGRDNPLLFGGAPRPSQVSIWTGFTIIARSGPSMVCATGKGLIALAPMNGPVPSMSEDGMGRPSGDAIIESPREF